MTIWYILCSLGTFFSGFGIMFLEKSGNPATDTFLVMPVLKIRFPPFSEKNVQNRFESLKSGTKEI
jgi:hypothetical protein